MDADNRQNAILEGAEKAAEVAQDTVGNGRVLKEFVEWGKALAIAVLLVILLRAFLFVPFIVDGDSMEPNFTTHERLIVNKIVYAFKGPDRGEVVVFNVPEEGKKFIKRVIGLPGDTVKVEGDSVWINGEKLNETYLVEAIKMAQANGHDYNTGPDLQEKLIPEGTFFVMGDNRGYSKDSRQIGVISKKEIIGRADLVIWPPRAVHFVGHD